MNRAITIALPTEDRVRAYEFYRSALNLTPVGEPAGQPWGFSAVVTDPDGHAWQLIASHS